MLIDDTPWYESRCDLTASDHSVLVALATERRLTTEQIVRTTGMSPAVAASVAYRLLGRGLAIRVPGAAPNGRTVLVLSTAGRTVVNDDGVRRR